MNPVASLRYSSVSLARASATLYTDSAWNELTALARAAAAPTTTRFGWLNARKKHNLPYIETIHIQLGRCYVASTAALRRPSGERFIIVPWKMLKSFLKKRMLNQRRRPLQKLALARLD